MGRKHGPLRGNRARRFAAVMLGPALAMMLAGATGLGAPAFAAAAATKRPAVGATATATGGRPVIITGRVHPGSRASHPTRAGAAKRNTGAKHPPAVTTQPRSTTVAAGAVASFTTAASGNPTPSLQWQRSSNRGKTWANLPGANSPTYSLVSAAAENGYLFRAVFINSLGRVYTSAATLTVSGATASAPTVTAQPASLTVVKNTVVAFTAAASGYPAPSAQWQVSTNGGSTWSNVSGATAPTYQFTTAVTQNGYRYRAVFANATGSAASAAATLTVTSGAVATTGAPTVSTDPINVTAATGATATFSAAAGGNPAPTAQWQVSTDGGTSWTNVSGATSATYGFTAQIGANGNQYRAVFTNSLGSVDTTAATLTVAYQSSNWSGYAVSGGLFSSVSADWTVPTITCPPASTSFSSQWIGIDGFNSNTVEQDGTEADCSSGSPYYGAWYEMYGDPSVSGGYEVPLENPVHAGDAMTATVSISGTTWTLAIADSTQNWTFSTDIPSASPAPAQSSAEWIGERPEVCSSSCGLANLSNFGSFSFTHATATDASQTNAPISSFAYAPLEMVGSTLLAAPGPLSAAGSQFTDTWTSST